MTSTQRHVCRAGRRAALGLRLRSETARRTGTTSARTARDRPPAFGAWLLSFLSGWAFGGCRQERFRPPDRREGAAASAWVPHQSLERPAPPLQLGAA